MSNTLTSFLWFDRGAEDAAAFYTSLFDDGRITRTTLTGSAGPGGSARTGSRSRSSPRSRGRS